MHTAPSAQYLSNPLPESRRAPPHNLPLTHQFRIELTSVQRQVNIEIHPIKRPLRGIHSLKVLLEILPRKVRGEGDDFLDSGVFGVFGAVDR
jgi:hypothetical protein